MATPLSSPPPIPTDSLIITESAIEKIHDLMQEEENVELALRIFVEGGGCSGLQYGFGFVEQAESDDMIIRKEFNDYSIKVVVDSISYPYLAGAKVDYRKDLQGERFIVSNNPNAKTNCGCGSSFSADLPEETTN